MSELAYPYRGVRNNTCNYNSTRKVASCTNYIQLDSGSESELKKSVETVGPVSVGIQASFPSMQFYSTGVYFEPNCDPNKINHAVLVVGYGSENGTDFWIIKNTWGTKWGGNKNEFV